MKPYYTDDYATIYHGDCLEVAPSLGRFDLVLTDPPYGIGLDRGMGVGGKAGIIPRNPRRYVGGWDKDIPADAILMAVGMADYCIIWGGQYFAGFLPPMKKWIVWDKENTMPTYSDAELAWTTLPGVSLKMFRQSGNGLLAVEKDRFHPTQKPVALMRWCIELAGEAHAIFDPFMGSGTTAAKQLNRRAVGIEKEERYCEIAAKRLAQGVLPLFGE